MSASEVNKHFRDTCLQDFSEIKEATEICDTAGDIAESFMNCVAHNKETGNLSEALSIKLCENNQQYLGSVSAVLLRRDMQDEESV